jgi:hypothetical protein
MGAFVQPPTRCCGVAIEVPDRSSQDGVVRIGVKAQETGKHFSENKERSIALLRKAISTLAEEIADAEPVVVAVEKPKATPVVEAQTPKATPAPEVAAPQHSHWGGMTLAAAWRRVRRWLRGRI